MPGTRIIAAPRTDLHKFVALGKYRADLYRQLMDYAIKLPPLREREADTKSLAELFLCGLRKNRLPEINRHALAQLIDYPWPGNVRELKNVVERLNLACDCDPIVSDCLPFEIHATRTKRVNCASDVPEPSLLRKKWHSLKWV